MEKFGVMFGNPEDIPWFTSPLKDIFSVSVVVRSTSVVKNGDRAVGFDVMAHCVKNRLAVPLRNARFSINYRDGIMDLESIVDFALSSNLLEKKQRGFSFDGQSIGRKRFDVILALSKDQPLRERLRQAVLLHFDAE
jgi:recombination protein RecA